MWQALFEIIPKPAILALAAYGAISWYVTGPLVAQRVAAVYHYPGCVAGLKAPLRPGVSPADKVLNDLERLPFFQSPLMRQLGLDGYLDLIRREREARREAARMSRPDPARKCVCLIAHAIERSRTAWAVHAASLRQIAWAEISGFDSLIREVEKEGRCHG